MSFGKILKRVNIRNGRWDRLAEGLGIALPRPAGSPAPVVAFVGAGGKTTALFAAAEAAGGSRVLATTTTHIRDPRSEPGRRFAGVFTDPALARPAGTGEDPAVVLPPWLEPGAGPLIVASSFLPESGKLAGIHPSRTETLRLLCDLILVEADGARGLQVKAPGPGEPAIPSCAGIVVGLISLDCLGSPMDGSAVHRPERFGRITGCAAGQSIGAEHIAALVGSGEGLFKGCPPDAKRILLLNKADRVPAGKIGDLLRCLESSAIPETGTGPASLRNSGKRQIGMRPSSLRRALVGRILVCSLLRHEIIDIIDLAGGASPPRNDVRMEGWVDERR